MHKENKKYRRMVERLPSEMKDLMSHLNHKCIVLEHHSGSTGWHVDFKIRKSKYRLIYDRGYLEVIHLNNQDNESISPVGKTTLNVKAKDCAIELNNYICENNDSPPAHQVGLLKRIAAVLYKS